MWNRLFQYGAGLLVALALGAGHAVAAADDYANQHLLKDAPALFDMIAADAGTSTSVTPADLRIVDVRAREKFEAGHVPGAISLPFTDLTDPNAAVAGALKSDEDLAALLGAHGISQTTEVVIYDDRGGFRAARLFWLLEYFGHRKVSLLNGGIQAWESAGNTVVKTGGGGISPSVGDAGPAVFSITRTPRRYASADYIMERRMDRETIVIDVRPEKAYAKGFIPWAINMPWSRNLDEVKMIKTARELTKLFEGEGVTPDMNIVIHCQTGEASAHTYFVLRLMGYPKVRTYHRSWAEWGASDDLPKAAIDAS
ncbi:MAG: sulfurtransferase [Roseibium sp.]|nr:sulfurtransferase [Roseibium sp.]